MVRKQLKNLNLFLIYEWYVLRVSNEKKKSIVLYAQTTRESYSLSSNIYRYSREMKTKHE